MKYQFVKTIKHPRNTGVRVIHKSLLQREEMRKLREELSDCLVFTTQDWTENTTLAEAREAFRGCILEAQQEGLSPEESRRMLLNLDNIQDRVDLERYAYNYKLRASGLSVYSVVKGK